MTIKITPEAVKERIAALESAGELSLKEQFYLEALRLLVAAMDSEPVVSEDVRQIKNTAAALEYIGNFADAAIILQLAANQQQNAQQNIPEIIPDSCTWTFSNYDDHWSGTCGVEWIFPDGGPEENGVKFCPKCGKSVAVSATEGTEE